MHVVATSRGAPGRVRERHTRRLPMSGDASSKIMWGSIPLSHWPRKRARSSSAARAGSKRAMPMAVKHESHSHWWG